LRHFRAVRTESDSCSDKPAQTYSVWSRYRRWLIPGLITTFILILILAFGVSSDPVFVADAAKGVQRLSFSVESNKDQLNSVAESLKQLSQLEVLSKTVAALKCTAASGCCPLEWDMFETSCFLFSKVSMSWHEARDWCHAHQSQLLILNADKDWDYVASRTSGVHYWIGLTDEGGKWEWVNGTPYTIDRRRWRPGQPDNWEGHGMGAGTEDCAHLHSEGRLNDMHCLPCGGLPDTGRTCKPNVVQDLNPKPSCCEVEVLTASFTL
uniref:C-type lectin domain-containing protein n=1 Tax=Periophthalmus magnuspinnatus TaxID=409849 RepID=A0A3B3ZVE9_9GOBI